MTITFFDVVSAMRERRTLRFTSAGNDVVQHVNGIICISRTARYWRIDCETTNFNWEESNTGAVVISAV